MEAILNYCPSLGSLSVLVQRAGLSSQLCLLLRHPLLQVSTRLAGPSAGQESPYLKEEGEKKKKKTSWGRALRLLLCNEVFCLRSSVVQENSGMVAPFLLCVTPTLRLVTKRGWLLYSPRKCEKDSACTHVCMHPTGHGTQHMASRDQGLLTGIEAPSLGLRLSSWYR